MNKGAAVQNVTVQMDVSATNYELVQFQLSADESWVNDADIILTSTDSIEVVTSSTSATDVVCSYLELT